MSTESRKSRSKGPDERIRAHGRAEALEERNRDEDRIIVFYAKGVSTREIQDHLQNLYGIEVSPTLISNVMNKIVSLIKPLQGVYAVVYMDAIHFKVKQNGAIVNKAAYMVIGIYLDGNKDVLGMWIGENETSKFWLSVLNDLRNRGVLITEVGLLLWIQALCCLRHRASPINIQVLLYVLMRSKYKKSIFKAVYRTDFKQ